MCVCKNPVVSQLRNEGVPVGMPLSMFCYILQQEEERGRGRKYLLFINKQHLMMPSGVTHELLLSIKLMNLILIECSKLMPLSD